MHAGVFSFFFSASRFSPSPQKHRTEHKKEKNKPAAADWQKKARLPSAKNLPMANKKFAVYPVRNLPLASEALAGGKLFICRRQTKNLQSASAPLADGKIHPG
ncbi:MAG TPA: hypothetical protein IAA30_08625 [Candidatus Treponema faecavium]|nr:hypothetical protein [Candidatus Treponema faecavium]